MYPESKSSDREISKIQYYKCQVRGSEEYDVKPDYTVASD